MSVFARFGPARLNSPASRSITWGLKMARLPYDVDTGVLDGLRITVRVSTVLAALRKSRSCFSIFDDRLSRAKKKSAFFVKELRGGAAQKK